MSDRLEEFVRQNREQFDTREPDPSIWLRIQPERTPAVKERRSMRWLRVAAAVAMIFAGSAAGIYFLTGGKAEADQYSSELYREIRETEQYYNQEVSQRYEELRPYLVGDPAAEEMLRTDMTELDEVYAELKKDLKDNASNPEVIEAMILNYRVKLEILEDLLNQLKEKENQDEKDESVSL
jgi:predicted CopG family antitoxin